MSQGEYRAKVKKRKIGKKKIEAKESEAKLKADMNRSLQVKLDAELAKRESTDPSLRHFYDAQIKRLKEMIIYDKEVKEKEKKKSADDERDNSQTITTMTPTKRRTRAASLKTTGLDKGN